MRKLTYFGVFLGLSLIAWLVAWQGAESIGATLSEIGVGVLLLLPIYAVYLAMGVVSWRLLFVPGREPLFAVSLNAIGLVARSILCCPLHPLAGKRSRPGCSPSGNRCVGGRRVCRRGYDGTGVVAGAVGLDRRCLIGCRELRS